MSAPNPTPPAGGTGRKQPHEVWKELQTGLAGIQALIGASHCIHLGLSFIIHETGTILATSQCCPESVHRKP